MSNAVAIGLTRRSVLPFEDLAEYRSLVDALFEEHCPEGLTERHLVEEIAGVLWRKRRLCLAETAVYRRAMVKTMGKYDGTVNAALMEHDEDEDRPAEWVQSAVHATNTETDDGLVRAEEADASCKKALDLLNSQADAYQAALDALRQDLREGWEWEVEHDPKKPKYEQNGYTPDAKGLRKFLEGNVKGWAEKLVEEFRSQPRVREQAFGDALKSLWELEQQEAHLDRKLERVIVTLARLQKLRMSGGW
jgi:hypothetical protein